MSEIDDATIRAYMKPLVDSLLKPSPLFEWLSREVQIERHATEAGISVADARLLTALAGPDD